MKRLLLLAALFCVSSVLPGCPIYADDDDCFDDAECAPGYSCDFGSGECRSNGRTQCDEPSDCDGNQTCGRAGRCRSGDCTFEDVGCVSGYVCEAPSGRWECVRGGATGGAGGTTGEGGGGGDAAEGGTGAMSGDGGAGAASPGGSAGSAGEPAAGAGGAI